MQGSPVWAEKRGGTGGYKTDKVKLSYPEEFLISIHGYYGHLYSGGAICVRALTFVSNIKTHGPFGVDQGTYFCLPKTGDKIVGFYGRSGWYLDAIGAYMKPMQQKHESNAVHYMQRYVANPIASHDISKRIAEGDPLWPSKPLVPKGAPYEEPALKFVKEPAPCGTGPWGGEGGKPWDDGVYTGSKQIYLTRSEVISSIQIDYDRNGQSVWSVKHGGHTGTTIHRIKLEYPHEVLTCISGSYSAVGKEDLTKVLKSLTFYTSRGKYGPFGDEVGTFFTSTTTEGKILGFHGRSGSYLDALGVHMQHWLGSYDHPKSSFFRIFS